MTFLLRAAGALVLALAGPCTQAAESPRIGLVLGGGGARGAAHIGVLEVLERLRVPVHCLAGTSMGALVAGAFASGVNPERMRGEMTLADWTDMFQDNPDYSELHLREKRIAQRFLPGSEMGFKDGSITTPPGVVSGQKIKLFFNQLVRADLGEPDIAHLALPLAIVATDIGSGERVVFRSGSLTQAMRASMSVPGLMAPYEIGGRKLVDGGLVDNLPVGEVRDLCQPDVVIAVNVGTPLLPAREVGSLLSVTAQMVAILTEQNVTQSIAAMRSGDLYIRPDLQGIAAADFERHAEAAERGRRAAEALAPQLEWLALSAEAYAEWRGRLQPAARLPPQVDEVRITGLGRVHPRAVTRHVEQSPGTPLDTVKLNRDLLRAYGDGHYESVDYSLLREAGRTVLRVAPLEKSWGPDYLRFALALSTTLSQGSTYSLRAAYQKTWLNAWGAEALFGAELGSTSGASAEFYQPLDARQRFFVDAAAAYRRERLDLFVEDDRVAEYRVERSTLDLTGGLNFGPLGQLRLGWRAMRINPSLETGLPLLPTPSRQVAGWVAALELDTFNRLYFPTNGWSLRAGWFSAEGDGLRYDKAQLELRGAWPLTGGWVLGSRAAITASPRGTLPGFDGASLGGFLNLSAYSNGQLLADSARYLHVRAERIIGTLPLGLRGDMRMGIALETGRIGHSAVETRHGGWLDSTTVYVGGETPVGPVYLGAGYSTRGVFNAYLFIGAP